MSGWQPDRPRDLPHEHLDLAAGIASEHVRNLLTIAEDADLGELGRAFNSLSVVCRDLADLADMAARRVDRDATAAARLRQAVAPALRKVADDLDTAAGEVYAQHGE